MSTGPAPVRASPSNLSLINFHFLAKASTKSGTIANSATPTALSTSDRVTKTNSPTQPMKTSAADESTGDGSGENHDGSSDPPHTGSAVGLRALGGKLEVLTLSLLLVAGSMVLAF